MIEAFELHDGSIIRASGRALTVLCLDNDYKCKDERRLVHFKESQGAIGVLLKHCEGEPLSEDWLLAFTFICRQEFDRKTYSYTYQDDAFTISLHENAAGRNEFWYVTRDFGEDSLEHEWTCRVKLDFVHELQNLYQAIEKRPLTIKAK